MNKILRIAAWRFLGGILAIASLTAVLFFAGIVVPFRHGDSMTVIVLIYAFWFAAGAISIGNFVNFEKVKGNEK